MEEPERDENSQHQVTQLESEIFSEKSLEEEGQNNLHGANNCDDVQDSEIPNADSHNICKDNKLVVVFMLGMPISYEIDNLGSGSKARDLMWIITKTHGKNIDPDSLKPRSIIIDYGSGARQINLDDEIEFSRKLDSIPAITLKVDLEDSNSIFESQPAKMLISHANVVHQVRIIEPQELAFIVESLPSNYKKAFLGGYRDRNTDIEYHHATAQTNPPKLLPPEQPIMSRETQTQYLKHVRVATVKESATQMRKPGYFVGNTDDKLLKPGPYETAEHYHKRVLQAVIVLQKHLRSWQARKRRMHPRKKSDFDRVYNALQEWLDQELRRIYEEHECEAERKAAIAMLVERETELLLTIDLHKNKVDADGKEWNQHTLLRKAAEPMRWKAAKGDQLEMQTVYTVRGKEIFDIFETLRLDCLTQDERLDILLTLKHTVKEHDCPLTREIVDLVDREAYCMLNGMVPKNLVGLRKRILNRFVAYAKSPEFNPQIARFLPLPTGTKEGAKLAYMGNLVYCYSCNRYLITNKFSLHARTKHFGRCIDCERMANRSTKREDMLPYRQMLEELRISERQLEKENDENCSKKFKNFIRQRIDETENLSEATTIATNDVEEDSSIIKMSYQIDLLVNEDDILYIVSDIWANKSCLSGWPNMIDLVLSRWRLNEPWSPWNTILLTREEAQVHRVSASSLELNQIYGETLLYKVKQREVVARNVFRRLYSMGLQRRERKFNQKDLLQSHKCPLPLAKLT
ncbi:hypothetical protein Ciccas_009853 [Cichlidogyrus casuarinus]|uniref:IQ motif and ubiquitin-like domain-containing protein n=1 Tax=Cichlidogyrus casuarinus TaxID=1844966 RepID=A0ABD2PVT0_9PLAT